MNPMPGRLPRQHPPQRVQRSRARTRPVFWLALLSAVLLALAMLAGSCAPRPPVQPGGPPRPSVAQELAEAAWQALQPVLVDAAHQVLDVLLGWATGRPQAAGGMGSLGPAPSAKPAPLGSLAAARATRIRGRDASAEGGPGAIELVNVRRWTRPAKNGHRVRLEASSSGRLLVSWAEGRGGSFRAVLEGSDGQVLDEQLVNVPRGSPVRHHQALISDGQLLVRDGNGLELGGDLVGPGEWESYSGVPGAIIAWAPCALRPCRSSVLHQVGGAWRSSSWPPEIFGLDLAEASSSTVRIASREQPNSGGWTLRLVDGAELRRGKVDELGERLTWKPPRNVSLEDPRFVAGAEPPMLVGGGALHTGDLPDGRPVWQPSGRVYLAEVLDGKAGPLRQVLEASPSLANAEPGAVVYQGTLHVVAELSADSSGLYRWESGQGLQLAAAVPGGAPAIAAAEGSLWVATSSGLWRTP